MKTAEQIVKDLLEADEVDPKAFINRHANLTRDMVVQALADQGVTDLQLIDGIEVYPMVDDGEGGQCRVDNTDPGVSIWGVSVHVKGGGLYDIEDYNNPDDARAMAEFMKTVLPHVDIFIDEI